jgi:hypothetical protein
MAIIAMTTSNSIKVKPYGFLLQLQQEAVWLPVAAATGKTLFIRHKNFSFLQRCLFCGTC